MPVLCYSGQFNEAGAGIFSSLKIRSKQRLAMWSKLEWKEDKAALFIVCAEYFPLVEWEREIRLASLQPIVTSTTCIKELISQVRFCLVSGFMHQLPPRLSPTDGLFLSCMFSTQYLEKPFKKLEMY